MKDNWNLSDKMESNSPELVEEYDLNNDEIDWFYKKDVKEFIRLLKGKIDNAEQSGYINDEQIDLRDEIDKLAGLQLSQ